MIIIWQVIKPENKQELPVLNIGINDWPGYTIAYYGQETGIFEQRGIKVKFIIFNNLQDNIRATLKGSLDATFIPLWDLMQTDIRTEKLVFLMVTNISAGSDGIVAQNNVKNVEDLKGKKIGAKLGTINHLVLLEALQLHNIEPHEITIENNINEIVAQKMKTKTLDAAVLWQPLLSDLREEINGNIIFTTKDVDSLVVDGFASSPTFLKTHKQEIIKFMLAWFDIMKLLEDNPDQVFQVVSQKIGQSRESFKNDYLGLKKGDIFLNQRMFQGRLEDIKMQIEKLLEKDVRSTPRIRNNTEINSKIINTALEQWLNN